MFRATGTWSTLRWGDWVPTIIALITCIILKYLFDKKRSNDAKNSHPAEVDNTRTEQNQPNDPDEITLKKIQTALESNADTVTLTGRTLTQVPHQVTLLTNLTCLELYRNRLKELPVQLTSLAKLNSLDVSKNPLRTYPTVIEELVGLKDLCLTSCKIPSIPANAFSKLSKLETLKIGCNHLSEFPIRTTCLTNLHVLELDDNNISRLPNLGLFPNLGILAISKNEFVSIPKEIGLLSNLQMLRSNTNKISSVPKEIASLRNCGTLDLQVNNLESLPEEISMLTNLTQIFLSDNRLTSLPRTLSNLQSLAVLDVSNNRLTSISEIRGLGTLQRIVARNNAITQVTAEMLTTLTSLQHIDLSRNSISHMSPAFGNLTKLRSINVTYNKITEIPPELGKLTMLRELLLSQNRFVQLPQEVYQLRDMNSSKLFLTSAIPDEIIPGLFLGNLEAAQFLEALQFRKVTHILRVLDQGEPNFTQFFEYKVIPVQDHTLQDLLPHIDGAVEFIDTGRKNGAVFVHCAAGVSRSATMVTAYLMFHLRIDSETALKMVREARPVINPNRGFREQLKQYELKLFPPQ